MAKGKLTTRYLSESGYPRWNRFVAASPSGSIYSTPEYLDTLCTVTGGRFSIMAVFKGDEIQAGLGLYKSSSLRGEYIASRLLLYYNGVVLRDFQTRYPSERTSRQLAAVLQLQEALSSLNCSRFLLHCRNLTDTRPFSANGWAVRPTYSYVMQIEDIKKAWERVEQNLRRLINRAGNSGVSFTFDDDFDSFFDMHFKTHQRKGSPLYLQKEPFRRFVNALLEKKLARLYMARLDNGQAVATQLTLLGDHPVTHTVCAGAEPEYLNLGSTPFLRWKAFENLSELGYKANDLTDAALNQVTRFKSQLGADLCTGYVIMRPDSIRWRSIEVVKRLAGYGIRIIRKSLKGVR